MLDTMDRRYDGSDLAAHRVDVRELDDASVMSFVVDQKRAEDRAAADLLAGVAHWADLHPVVDQPGDLFGDVAAAHPDHRSLGILPPSCDEQPRLAGEGAPEITEAAVVDLAAALGVSYRAGCRLVADALELHHRLPRLWSLVQSGVLPAWQARRAASRTTHLSRTAVDFVDRHLAVVARRGSLPADKINPLVHEALLQHDPDTALAVEESALNRRGVWFDHRESTATTTVTGVLDTLDAIDLDHTLSETAAQLKTLGDTDSLDVRRAHALGMLASPQRVLDLFSTDRLVEPGDRVVEPAGRMVELVETTPPAPGSRTGATLYVHVTLADLATRSGSGRVERLGAASLDLLDGWLTRLGLDGAGAGAGVTIRPVLDLARTDAVDQHDPPDWMREAVILRDRHCVFPGCRVDARSCDLDHIEPYVPITDDPDTTGPPGQTSPANLAALCRRHHRAKTHRAWTYQRRPPDERDPRDTGTAYTWTSPLGWTLTTRPI